MGMPTRAQNYREAVLRHFNFLKETTSLDALWTKSITLPNHQGHLVPVCQLHREDETAIKLFTMWRNEFAFAYPTQFAATDDSTRSWLSDRLLRVEDRMLFFVVDKVGQTIGHIGLSNAFGGLVENKFEIEIDNVVRGIKGGHPGLMAAAMNTLISWADQMFLPDQIYLRVFSDNDHAVKFYRNNGFTEGELEPLRKHEANGSVSYKRIESGDSKSADKMFLRMNFAPKIQHDPKQMILTAGPSISALEQYYAYDAAKTGWNNKWADYLKRFEKEFAAYVGTKHALTTSSCTGALHLALEALEIGPGDEVIVPDITWVASANVVNYVGATPIFADVDPKTWVLDPKSFESKITKKTKAVIPVHLYGHPVDMSRIVEIARKHGLYIVEDAAPSIGTIVNGQKTGSFGDFAAFSFQGAKLTVTGEGGMLVSNNSELFEKVAKIADQGRNPNKTFWIDGKGWKYKMSNVQAALGLAQLQRVEELIEAKRRIFGWYADRLEGVKQISLCYEPQNTRSIYWMSSIQMAPDARIEREDLRARLKAVNVDTRPVFPAISQYPIWPKEQAPQPNAFHVGKTGINLPSGVCLKEHHIDYVTEQIKKILNG